MMRPSLCWAALGLLVILCAGCGSIPKTHYYTLAPPPAPSGADAKTDRVLLVEPFRAAVLLRDDRIIYYKSPTELGYYQYHRWSADPAALLTDFAAGYLRATGAFRQVTGSGAFVHPDYILRGHVLNFDEVDYESGGKGRVGLELRLYRSSDNKIVWSARQDLEQPIQEKGMPGVVSAINAASRQLLSDMLSQMIAGLAPPTARNSR